MSISKADVAPPLTLTPPVITDWTIPLGIEAVKFCKVPDVLFWTVTTAEDMVNLTMLYVPLGRFADPSIVLELTIFMRFIVPEDVTLYQPL